MDKGGGAEKGGARNQTIPKHGDNDERNRQGSPRWSVGMRSREV